MFFSVDSATSRVALGDRFLVGFPGLPPDGKQFVTVLRRFAPKVGSRGVPVLMELKPTTELTGAVGPDRAGSLPGAPSLSILHPLSGYLGSGQSRLAPRCEEQRRRTRPTSGRRSTNRHITAGSARAVTVMTTSSADGNVKFGVRAKKTKVQQ